MVIILTLSAFIATLSNGTTVFATKWVELEPQEVSDRAETVVIGKYDFTSKAKKSGYIFQGYEFNVTHVYKGDVSQQIIVGIDENAIGTSDEFQRGGGEFLLFLEKPEGVNFLIPVGGPNGMIRISNGTVEHYTEDSKIFYEEFLQGDSKEPNQENVQNNSSLYISLGVLLGICVIGLLFFFRKKRR